MRARVVLLLISPLWVLEPAAAAEVYRWFDAGGNVHYSDAVPADLPYEVIDPELVAEGAEEASTRIERAPSVQSTPVAAAGAGPCFDARLELEILYAPGLAYATADGRFRAARAGDDYRGKREYLSESARPAAIESARRRVREHCGDPASFRSP